VQFRLTERDGTLTRSSPGHPDARGSPFGADRPAMVSRPIDLGPAGYPAAARPAPRPRPGQPPAAARPAPRPRPGQLPCRGPARWSARALASIRLSPGRGPARWSARALASIRLLRGRGLARWSAGDTNLTRLGGSAVGARRSGRIRDQDRPASRRDSVTSRRTTSRWYPDATTASRGRGSARRGSAGCGLSLTPGFSDGASGPVAARGPERPEGRGPRARRGARRASRPGSGRSRSGSG
jgi:hypothetical protein